MPGGEEECSSGSSNHSAVLSYGGHASHDDGNISHDCHIIVVAVWRRGELLDIFQFPYSLVVFS